MRTVFIVWNEAQTEGFVTDDRQAAHDASTGQQYSGVSSLAVAFAEMYEDDPQPLVVEEVQVAGIGKDADAPKVGDGTPDAALAIGEHAFRAGWDACDDASGVQTEKRTQTVDQAWDAYDPPEHIKALS